MYELADFLHTLDPEEMPEFLERFLAQWKEKMREAGRWEGRRQGEIAGMRKLLLDMMIQRFGPLPIQMSQRVQEISSTKVLLELGQKFHFAGSLQEPPLLRVTMTVQDNN
jgi:hypothetical protein